MDTVETTANDSEESLTTVIQLLVQKMTSKYANKLTTELIVEGVS